jgi:enterochelin esterase-like enzyme
VTAAEAARGDELDGGGGEPAPATVRPATSDAPKVLDRWVRFRLADPDHRYASVTLECDSVVPGAGRAFSRRDGRWELRIPQPALARLEYQLGLVTHEGHASTEVDPAHPLRVDTAFGQKSVLEMPGYRPPWWLAGPSVPGRYEPLVVQGETTDDLPVTVWAPEGTSPREPLPLLLVHDGPEYDVLASLTHYAGAMIATGRLPAHRLALLQPVQRNAWYSGSPQYLRTEMGAGLARLRQAYAVAGDVAVMGASLGGLTALLAGLHAPEGVGAVFSQSGSFFQVVHDDRHDSVAAFPFYWRISQRVSAILDARHTDHPLRIGLTCGALEENAPNNASIAAALRRAGHTVDHVTVPDLHNYTAWRDALDPHLTDLLRDCWRTTG